LAKYPQRIEFSAPTEKTIENILLIYWVQTYWGGVDIRLRGPHKQLCEVPLTYMACRLPPCLFFYCGQRNIVNMKRVKSCCFVGKRIKLSLIGGKVIYVSRLHTEKFLALLTLYPDITWIEGA
jgi:DNA-binding LytR/AlgR family response regulator